MSVRSQTLTCHTHIHTHTSTHLAHPHFHAYNVRERTLTYTHMPHTHPHTHIHPLSLTLTSIPSRGGIHVCFETNKVPLCGRTSFVQESGSVCRSTPSSVPRSACKMPCPVRAQKSVHELGRKRKNEIICLRGLLTVVYLTTE